MGARCLRFLFSNKPKDFKQIPVFINNYNRLTTTKKLIDGLVSRGYTNIHILDNKSTYKPLLEFYEQTPHKVHLLKKNYGSKAFWKSGLWLKYTFSNYALTDSDIVLNSACPDDFIEYFYKLLEKYPKAHKVGFSLKIDDLPDSFKNKEEVIKWEGRYYKKEVEPNVFAAPIDTTFALYRPFSKKGPRGYSVLVLRTGMPYQARHLPWYIDNNNIDEEEIYYLKNIETRTHWSRQNKESLKMNTTH